MTSFAPRRTIFVTGATGTLGSAVVPALVQAGHRVSALSRDASRDALLRDAGATPVRGDLRDAAALERHAAGHDTLIHLAFDHSPDGAQVDVAATRALLRAASDRAQVIYTSGIWVLGATDGVADESTPTDHPAPLVAHRAPLEREVLAAPLGAVVRPGIVYGTRASLPEIYYGSAERDGAALVIGEGENHWPMIHRDDLARLYVALVEKRAPGVFHAVDGAPIRQREFARLASLHVGKGGAIAPASIAAARATLGGLADALALDQRIVAPRSERVLGWRPQRKGYPDGA